MPEAHDDVTIPARGRGDRVWQTAINGGSAYLGYHFAEESAGAGVCEARAVHSPSYPVILVTH